MLLESFRRSGPRRALFTATVLALCGALGWLTWRLVDQDRLLAAQRARETAADFVVAAFEQRLTAVERQLDAALSDRDRATIAPPDADAVVIRISSGSLAAWPPQRLRYYPQLPASDSRQVASAETLVAAARNHLTNGRYATALEAYKRLATLGEVSIAGYPAALAAAVGRLAVYQQQDDVRAQKQTAAEVDAALRGGKWPVTLPTYDSLRERIRPLIDADDKGADPQLVLAEAVEWLWEQQATPAFSSSGRVSRAFPSGPGLVVWRRAGRVTLATVVGSDGLRRLWTDALPRSSLAEQINVAITTADGQPIAGAVPASERSTVRLSSATTLPWTVQVTAGSRAGASVERRDLLFAGVGIWFLLIAGGAWVIERTVARQLAVADLQSDFVSAVSHEFRTPLTTICQLTELLNRNRVANESDRRQYYEMLHNESQRLRRLVETLLNFGRLEAGRMEFRREALDFVQLVRVTIADFSASAQARGHRVQLASMDGPVPLHADREVLRTLVWNLLENAAKYSPDCDTIWVALRREASEVTLEVQDKGVGIPKAEQRRVFEKFVRGASARSSEVGGTGVGLAMVRRIVDAHGGRISLESKPGAGSTFSVTLPLGAQLAESPSPAAVAAG